MTPANRRVARVASRILVHHGFTAFGEEPLPDRGAQSRLEREIMRGTGHENILREDVTEGQFLEGSDLNRVHILAGRTTEE
jgi:hypothetical protein